MEEKDRINNPIDIFEKEEYFQQKRNEELFFKIFKNKYLLNYILNQVEIINMEKEIKYNNKKKQSSNSLLYYLNEESKIFRIKFKDLKSLNFMLEKEQYELIKCKIIHNEVIEFDRKAINILFKVYSDGFEIIVEEIFKLLFQYKIDEIMKFNILQMLISHYNYYSTKFDLFKMFVLPPFSLSMTPKLFENVISSWSFELFKNFIELAKDTNSSIVNEEFKNNSIEIVMDTIDKDYSDFKEDHVIRQNKEKEQILLFLLNDSKYYNSPYRNDLSVKRNNMVEEIIELNSTELQVKLIENNYYNSINSESLSLSNYGLSLISKLIESDDNINTLLKDKSISGIDKLKQIYKNLSRFSNKIYLQYLIKFEEIDLIDSETISYIMYSECLTNIFQKVLELSFENRLFYQIIDGYNLKDYKFFQMMKNENFYKFLKLYVSIEKYGMVVKELDIHIKKAIDYLKLDKEKYNLIMDSVSGSSRFN